MSNRFKFGKEKIEALALPDAGKRATYYDETVPKLALRVTGAGAKTFYLVKRVGAEMTWLKLGSFPDMSVENARFKKPVLPGDQLKVDASIIYHKRGMWRFKAQATVEGQLVSEAELMCTLRTIE